MVIFSGILLLFFFVSKNNCFELEKPKIYEQKQALTENDIKKGSIISADRRLQTTTSTYSYTGCYGDRNLVRAMSTKLGTGMTTVLQCFNLAISGGFLFFGLEAGKDCYASNLLSDATRYGSCPTSTGIAAACKCNVLCGLVGPDTCGGTWALDVYSVITLTTAPSAVPVSLPTFIPSINPSGIPTVVPSVSPTINPSVSPTVLPSVSPTIDPSVSPTTDPSVSPTDAPSFSLTIDPSVSPSTVPSDSPTPVPSSIPTNYPSTSPTLTPSFVPARTAFPSLAPILSSVPLYNRVGCYGDLGVRAMAIKLGTAMTSISQCYNLAVAGKYLLFGLVGGKDCYASNVLADATRYGACPTSTGAVRACTCNLKCVGSIDTCGGSWAIELYSIQSPLYPSVVPSVAPVVVPIIAIPSALPTSLPTFTTAITSASPSLYPLIVPSVSPSFAPVLVTQSTVPSNAPIASPTTVPVLNPTVAPVVTSSLAPIAASSLTGAPSLAPILSSVSLYNRVGCYGDLGVRAMAINLGTAMKSISQCYNLAVAGKYLLFGLVGGKDCYASNVLADATRYGACPTSTGAVRACTCNLKCVGSIDTCGGSWAIELYSIQSPLYPSMVPSIAPASVIQIIAPSNPPITSPTAVPILNPTVAPIVTSSLAPVAAISLTVAPNVVPSIAPVLVIQSIAPSNAPIASPTTVPILNPTVAPIVTSSLAPVAAISLTVAPNVVPSIAPVLVIQSIAPSNAPIASPTTVPILNPTVAPIVTSSLAPVVAITLTVAPNVVPSIAPVLVIQSIPPSNAPIASPTTVPILNPTVAPVVTSSLAPIAASSLTGAPSLSPILSSVSLYNRVGCYGDLGVRAMAINLGTAMKSISQCYNLAVAGKYLLFGLVGGKDCYASNVLADATRYGACPTSTGAVRACACNLKCVGSIDTCGGSWAIELYSIQSPLYPSAVPSIAPASVIQSVVPSRAPIASPTVTPIVTSSLAPIASPSVSPIIQITSTPSFSPSLLTSGTGTSNASPTKKIKNVAYFGDESGWFYAIDIATGTSFWRTFLGYTRVTFCSDLPGGNFSITGTPVFDRSINTIYVVGGAGSFNALSMVTGAVLWRISNFYDPQHLHNYGALLLYNDVVYAAMGAMCDLNGVFLGGVYSVDTLTRTMKNYFAPYQGGPPGAYGGGIWGLGGVTLGDMASPATSHIYTPTGNCIRTTSQDSNYCEKLVKLNLDLTVAGFIAIPVGFKPDNDLGSSITYFNALTELQSSGCKSPLVSAYRKDGMFTVATADSFKPKQYIQLGNPGGAGSIQQAAWDPFTNTLVVPQGSTAVATATSPAYVSSVVGLRLNATCHLNTIWATNTISMSSPTIVGVPGKRLALIVTGFGLKAIDVQTGVLLATKNLFGAASNAPVVINGTVLMGTQGSSVTQRGVEGWR